MSDTIILMHASNLPGIAKEAHQHELLRTLAGLQTNSGKNYAIYSDPDFTPTAGIVILPFPSVGPAGSTKICDGELTIGGNRVKVTAYRL
ncbi:MAG: hypothetical protein E6G94_16325 [Alphaproteobacteria bacterium]|nr:MAG: hypothetical protein E6G94_16325 [Alphaproteobacteria bacterium]